MFTLTLDTATSACEEAGEFEVARILRSVALEVERGARSGLACDANGVRVGRWSLDLVESDVSGRPGLMTDVVTIEA